MRVAEASNFRASVSEISLELNVSRRTIEHVFRDLMGESPWAYFTLRRLNLCKQALMEANHRETSVTIIATGFGFYELGRFASYYHRHFGELPSQTLRRSSATFCK
jgi:transcriptional regulator GlxA family with amidase domain